MMRSADQAPSSNVWFLDVLTLSPLENEAKPQLNLTRRIHSRKYPTGVIGEIATRIFKDSVSVSSQSNRVLRITGDSEIRMIQEVERFGA